ncbi:MAG: DUF1669 domain-containing protein [Epsilonproteobacteria bacterium]|nr:DUF1669 domain-containing protein [Campylobacterota bacterium]
MKIKINQKKLSFLSLIILLPTIAWPHSCNAMLTLRKPTLPNFPYFPQHGIQQKFGRSHPPIHQYKHQLYKPHSQSVHTKVYFSPDRDEKHFKAIKHCIDNSTSSIKAALFIITDEPITQALCDAQKRGAKVELIVDKSSVKHSRPMLSTLKNSGVDVSLYDNIALNKAFMHHKFAVFDDKTVVSGSANWTHRARKENEENVIISKGKRLCQQFLEQFERIKKYTRQYKEPT